MKWQWQQNILGNHSEWWDHLRARYLFPLLLFPPLCLLSPQLYTIQMSQQNTIQYRWSTQLYMIQMLRHAPRSEICSLFLLPLLLLLSFYPHIMPSTSSFLPLDIPPFDDEDENDNGERPWYDLHIQTFSIWERWWYRKRGWRGKARPRSQTWGGGEGRPLR